jgi:hypothetical protein
LPLLKTRQGTILASQRPGIRGMSVQIALSALEFARPRGRARGPRDAAEPSGTFGTVRPCRRGDRMRRRDLITLFGARTLTTGRNIGCAVTSLTRSPLIQTWRPSRIESRSAEKAHTSPPLTRARARARPPYSRPPTSYLPVQDRGVPASQPGAHESCERAAIDSDSVPLKVTCNTGPCGA